MYRPLRDNEIRLLVLHPGPEVSGDLIHVPLDVLPSYETISYAWGDGCQRGTMILDNEPFDVPVNTRRALERMKVDQDRVLWIDAVCINQGDVEERGKQVALMATIFSSGDGNLVWLGEDDDGSAEAAVASMQLLVQDAESYEFTMQVLSEGYIPSWTISKIKPMIDQDAIVHFFSSTWFQRRWIVQEILLAKHNICHRGSISLPLEQVLQSAFWIYYNYLTFAQMGSPAAIEYAATMFRYLSFNQMTFSKYHLFTLLNDTVGLRTSDPRDCIYALLALYQKLNRQDQLPEDLRPSYSSSIADVFTRAATFCIAEVANMDLLLDAEEHEQYGKLPSWVPQFDRAERHTLILLSEFAADFRMRKAHCEVIDFRLRTHGYRLSEVVKSTETLGTHLFQDPNAMATAIKEMIDIVETTLQQPTDSVLGITLCAGRCFDGSLAREMDAAEKYRRFAQKIVNGAMPPWPADWEYIPSSSEGQESEYLHEFLSCSRGRKFFATNKHIGTGPPRMRLGDTLAIISGCRWPVILRPRDGAWEFIGVSYVYGIMFGEAMAECQESTMESFVLV